MTPAVTTAILRAKIKQFFVRLFYLHIARIEPITLIRVSHIYISWTNVIGFFIKTDYVLSLWFYEMYVPKKFDRIFRNNRLKTILSFRFFFFHDADRGRKDMGFGMGFGLFSRTHPKRYGISPGPTGYLIQILCNHEFFPKNMLKSLPKD